MINLSLTELQMMAKQSENIQMELKNIVTKLLVSYDNINTCVQSSGLRSKIENLQGKVTDISYKVLRDLPATTDFLKSQIACYSQVNETTKNAIEGLLVRIKSKISYN